MTPDWSVYLVTDAELASAAGHTLADLVAQAVAGGVTAVQVREKRLAGRRFLESVVALAAIVPDGVPLIVNDRVDVFLAARALGAAVAGVHVGQDDLPVGVVRALVGPDAIVGVSAATPAELAAAQADGADYVGIGSLHTTSTKADAPGELGLAGFAALLAATTLPAVAIGGVSASDLAGLRRAGAAGGAVVSAVCSAPDPRAAAQALADAWRAGA